MIEILVSRDPGDKLGPNITDPLITSTPVALAKGAAAINGSCSDRKILRVSTTMMPLQLPGGLVGITTIKGRRVGKLRSMEKTYQISGQEFSADVSLYIEVVSDK